MAQVHSTTEDSLKTNVAPDTTVYEEIAPAVTQETVVEARHEEATQAVDRQIHQDHYHVSVQPLQDKQVLAEQHEHEVEPLKKVEFNHKEDEIAKQRSAEEIAAFKDVKEEGDTVYTYTEGPRHEEEQVHHHVHEVIQPVIQREIIQPIVIHKHVPIQEIHHQNPKHHTATDLPPMSIAEFEQQGGTLVGRKEISELFPGIPAAEREASTNFDAEEAQKRFRNHRRSSPGSTLVKFQEEQEEKARRVHG